MAFRIHSYDTFGNWFVLYHVCPDRHSSAKRGTLALAAAFSVPSIVLGSFECFCLHLLESPGKDKSTCIRCIGRGSVFQQQGK